jgi:NADH dehydrogenase
MQANVWPKRKGLNVAIREAKQHRPTPRVVIVGAGFGGLACAWALGNKPVAVTVVDRCNFHLFVPLLYQVATAVLSPADVAHPIRSILRRFKNIDVLMDEVLGIDPAARFVNLRDGPAVSYDVLVVATGSEYAYFGHGDWAALAPGLKSIEDAQEIRARLLRAFERAEISRDPDEQQALITTIIVGGGPTGVEMAGSVAELDRHALARDFRHVRPQSARVILVEAGPRILSSFPESLAAYARERLERLGVTVWTGKAVEEIEPDRVRIAGEWIRAGTIIWGAGVQASPAGEWIPGERDRMGRIVVAPDLSVPALEGVFVLGDLAHCKGADGDPLPALAQVAAQQGRHLGRALAANLTSGVPLPRFEFHDRGNTAIIGRNAAIFDFGRWRMKGFLAWVLWAIVHIYLLVGFEKRLLVAMQWLWLYATYQRGARLILPTGRRALPRR